MVSLFNGWQTDSLESLRSRFLSKKVCTANSFVKPERLPPTTFSAKLQSRRTYLQLMQWMCKTNGIQIQLTGAECYKGGNWSPLWWTKIQHQSPCWKWSIAVAPQDAVQRDVAAKRVDLNALQLADIYMWKHGWRTCIRRWWTWRLRMLSMSSNVNHGITVTARYTWGKYCDLVLYVILRITLQNT